MTHMQGDSHRMGRGVRSLMRRTTAGRAARPPRSGLLLCVLQTLLLLFLAALPLLHCNAIMENRSNVSAPTRAAKANTADGTLATIKSCYPGALLFDTNIRYYCEVDDASALVGLDLRASYYVGSGNLHAGWQATLEKDSNIVSFVPNSGATSGYFDVVIARVAPASEPPYVPMTSSLKMEFRSVWSTSASLDVSDPYYGMTLKMSTNFPETQANARYLFVGSSDECQHITTSCSPNEGCYDMRESARLPPTGSYNLCVTADGWHDHYLPWGQSALEVKALVATPLYLMRGSDIVVALEDAATGAAVEGMKIFLVQCTDNKCLRVTLRESGETAVHLDVCENIPESQRVFLSAGSSLSASEGVYAACASSGTDGGVSPAALPISVIEKPFAFNVVADTNTLVTIHVSGGDLAWREKPYIMCAVPSSVACESVSTSAQKCVTSASAREPSVTMDLTDTELTIDNATFCLVATQEAFMGRTHTWVTASENFEPMEKGSLNIGAILGIVLAAVVVAVAVVLLVVCVVQRRRRRQVQQVRQERKKRANDMEAPPPSAPTAAANPLGAADAAPSPARGKKTNHPMP